jgi:hypothetical protein
LAQACARCPAERETDGDQPRGQALRPPSPRRRHPREPFRKDTAGALWIAAEELADAELPSDAGGTPGEIGQHALVGTVKPMGPHGADWTGHVTLRRGHVQRDQGRGAVNLPGVEVDRNGIG